MENDGSCEIRPTFPTRQRNELQDGCGEEHEQHAHLCDAAKAITARFQYGVPSGMEKSGSQDDSDNGKRHPEGSLGASCVLNEIAAAENRYFLRKTAIKLTNVLDASFIERSAGLRSCRSP